MALAGAKTTMEAVSLGLGATRSLRPILRMAEARTLKFIAKNTTIPVPYVLDAFTHDGMLDVVMDYIDAPS